jgi:Asp-tRNA(Asn)/Glu-tRNA(Gln) amidotransferase A subunit family amidase
VRDAARLAVAALLLLSAPACRSTEAEPEGAGAAPAFHLQEATIQDIHAAYKAGTLTARQLTQLYLNRIEAYDKQGPRLNSIITLNPKALEDADKLDAAMKASGFVGPLHGIPVIVKDQADTQGMPMTMGSIMLKDYYPARDAFAVGKVRQAGAIILGKSTLGEWGGGDTYGSLFGITRNPYAPERTPGGSSGGTGASISANLAAVGIGQEGFASIRRPSTYNALVGMRPTAGLVSRAGVYQGWPSMNGSLGPMARTVQDLATLLDVMVGYDPEDPLTALGVGRAPKTYTAFLDRNGLAGARIGVLREVLGGAANAKTEDFAKVTPVFEAALGQLKAAGAELVDPVTIPDLMPLLAKRARDPAEDEAMRLLFARTPNAPFKSRQEVVQSPLFAQLNPAAQQRLREDYGTSPEEYHQYVLAREQLVLNIARTMADHRLDAIVHKSMESPPPLIEEKPVPRSLGGAGPPVINTTAVFISSIAVPAGFIDGRLPAGITFMGRPYDEPTLIKLAYAFEQATRHRKPPAATPPLRDEP